ncbi:hypothetical protein CDAR_554141 [Caerostris darwini]|uniref:Uncharacterized protein n=1 Tax=Caerostris darwini TaxID=1538125 RepID=A0AAV4R199_9ARAC|nr:hypothetical protein CDAR_554141 [Caerostris darwini]
MSNVIAQSNAVNLIHYFAKISSALSTHINIEITGQYYFAITIFYSPSSRQWRRCRYKLMITQGQRQMKEYLMDTLLQQRKSEVALDHAL